ncbi:MAG TPA: transcription termination factor NusA [candidate division WOR-3 bacterium]|uniref:Transcription termination/antitermination protein NusA n=1 Tax=candidate division WOR-3 bacterium TaxID=2052148 RepID=A0A9C9EP51_UNCW3|nr:transcription termination factor NusA [candidate division WOR-3 bacterium]
MANEGNLIIENIKSIARARGVKFDYVIESLAEALKNGVKRKFGKGVESEVSVNKSTGEIKIFIVKKIVEEVSDPDKEISLEEAQAKDVNYKIGDDFRILIPISDLGRTAIESVKQTLTQRVSEAERNRIMAEYEKKVGEIVKGIVKVVSRNEVLVDLGPVEAVIPPYGMMRTEHYRLDSPIRAVVSRVDRAQWGPKIILSRTDPKFLERLLFYEIPEIKDGLIQVIKIVREPGVRAKVAVQTLDPKIDPIGACVGYRGSRIQSIVKELSGERIDVIQWSKESNLQISRSLSPARIKEVISLGEGHVLAVVPDDDYSKAIGKNGVNVDLASKLCEVEIEIKKVSEYEKDLKEKELSKIKIEDIDGLSSKLKKLMIEKGYTNVLTVLKAPTEELKFLLKLDDDGVADLKEKLGFDLGETEEEVAEEEIVEKEEEKETEKKEDEKPEKGKEEESVGDKKKEKKKEIKEEVT